MGAGAMGQKQVNDRSFVLFAGVRLCFMRSMGGIAIVAQRVEPHRGGLAVASSRIARHARAQGEEVHVLYLSKDTRAGTRGYRRRDDISYHPVSVLPDEELTLRTWTEHVKDITVEHKLDVLHGIYATHAGYIAVLVAGMLGLRSVVSLRGNDLDRGIFRARDFPFLAHTLSHATVVTAVSSRLAKTAGGVFGRPVVHVTNSVDADVFRPKTPDNSLRRSLGLRGRVIGFAGELREKKGMRHLLPAFAEVSKHRDVSLLLIGGVRDEAQKAFEAFKAMSSEAAKRIHVVAYRRHAERLCELLALCDLMVFPSLYDGTPNAVLEAMAAGRPILATDAGGHGDLIQHGETGALLPLCKLGQLAEAIMEFLDLPPMKREAMGRSARLFVVQHHAPQKELEAYRRVYRDTRSL